VPVVLTPFLALAIDAVGGRGGLLVPGVLIFFDEAANLLVLSGASLLAAPVAISIHMTKKQRNE
jgi:hypothetical protein